MQFTLEALQANDGDCLLLHYQLSAGAPVRVLIDGGSAGVYSSILKPRIDQLRGKNPLHLRMAMVSHIDSDHITGIVDLFKTLEEAQADGQDGFCQIQTLWHNSFEKLHGGKSAVVQSATVAASLDGGVPPGGLLDWETEAVVASVPQGNMLRKLATALTVPINQGAGGDLVSAPAHGQKIVKIADGLTFTVLAPNDVQLARLRAMFTGAAGKIKAGANDAAVGADYLNNTVPNMSSIVVMAQATFPGKKPLRMLLAGDARGDIILESLELAGLLDHGRCHVDLLKVQHHCSNHSTTQDFFERVIADRYVISGNGKHNIPNANALGWLSAARSKEAYDAYLTNRIGILDNKKTLDKFLAAEQKREKKHAYHFRGEKDLSIAVDLV
jgi:beta-lactamase superfamily II metal-dependent hydrolase